MTEQQAIMLLVIQIGTSMVLVGIGVRILSNIQQVSDFVGALSTTYQELVRGVEKRATPVAWATQLEAHFLKKEDEEGVMLAAAVVKHLRRNKRVSLTTPDLDMEPKSYE